VDAGATRTAEFRHREDLRHAVRTTFAKSAAARNALEEIGQRDGVPDDALLDLIVESLVQFRIQESPFYNPPKPRVLTTRKDLAAARWLAGRNIPDLSLIAQVALSQAEVQIAERRGLGPETRLMMRLNLLVISLVGLFRSLAWPTSPYEDFLSDSLPVILRVAAIHPPAGKSRRAAWRPDALRRRISRAGGHMEADKVALRLLALDRRLRKCGPPFSMYRLSPTPTRLGAPPDIFVVYVGADLPGLDRYVPPSWPRTFGQPATISKVAPDEADKILRASARAFYGDGSTRHEMVFVESAPIRRFSKGQRSAKK